MFFKCFNVLLHANCIGKIGFDNKWYEFANIQFLHHVKNVDK